MPDEHPIIQPFIRHMSLNAAVQLRVGSKVDHRDEVGKSLKAVLTSYNPKDKTFCVKYERYGSKWDTVSDPVKELWRFSRYNTLSRRPVLKKEMVDLVKGDMVDINSPRHPGWRYGTIRLLDMNKNTGERLSGWIQVRYKAEYTLPTGSKETRNYLFWVHMDNEEEVAPFLTKSAPELLNPLPRSTPAPNPTSTRKHEEKKIAISRQNGAISMNAFTLNDIPKEEAPSQEPTTQEGEASDYSSDSNDNGCDELNTMEGVVGIPNTQNFKASVANNPEAFLVGYEKCELLARVKQLEEEMIVKNELIKSLRDKVKTAANVLNS